MRGSAFPTIVYGYVTPFVGSVNRPVQNGIVRVACVGAYVVVCSLKPGSPGACWMKGSVLVPVPAEAVAETRTAASATRASADPVRGVGRITDAM